MFQREKIRLNIYNMTVIWNFSHCITSPVSKIMKQFVCTLCIITCYALVSHSLCVKLKAYSHHILYIPHLHIQALFVIGSQRGIYKSNGNVGIKCKIKIKNPSHTGHSFINIQLFALECFFCLYNKLLWSN